MAFDTSWGIGSLEEITDQTITINATPYILSGSSYYLQDSSAALSLCAQLEALMDNEVTNASVRLAEDRKVHLSADDPFAIVWSDADETRDALGFVASIGSTSDVFGTNISPLLWSPGWPAQFATPCGIESWEVKDTIVLSSPSGLTQKTTQHWESDLQAFDFSQVTIDRIWTATPGLGGEYRRFFDDVLEPGLRWKLYNVEESTLTTDVSLGTAFGPYKMKGPRDYAWYNRAIANTDTNTNITIRCQVVSEYT